MKHGRWLPLWGVQMEVRMRFAIPISEAGVSARIRDLRKAQYGGHTIERRKNGSLWEYKLVR